MPKRTSSQLDTKKLDSILARVDGNTADKVAKTAFMIEARAKVNIVEMGAVDTGALLNSVGVSLNAGGDVRAAMSAARALNPDANPEALPVPRDNHTAHVGPTVEYAADVHFGSGTMPGRPFLLEAVRATEKEFYAMFGDVVTDK